MPEVRERAVRLVSDHAHQHDSQWAATRSVAEKIGWTAKTLRHWVRQAEHDAGRRHEDFKANNSSARHALLAIVLVHHMHEWVHGTKFCVDHFTSAYENEDGMAERFDLAQGTSPTVRSTLNRELEHRYKAAFHQPSVMPLPNP